MAKRYRDAVTGEYITKEEAMVRKNESVAEETKPKKRKVSRKIPESGKNEKLETDAQKRKRIFDMKMDVVFKGDVYIKGQPLKELPKESQDYLLEKGWDKE